MKFVAGPGRLAGGGLDGCLYSTKALHGDIDHGHNRNLPVKALMGLVGQLKCKVSCFLPDQFSIAFSGAVCRICFSGSLCCLFRK